VLEDKGHRKLDTAQREGVLRALVDAETEHGVPVIVALALIELESGFDPEARGPSGAIGLMQLQPATARAVARRSGLDWQNERTLRDPETNARLGLAYLVELRTRFGTTEHALAAYNMGPGNLNRLLERSPLRRGPYLEKVHAHVDALRRQYGMGSGFESGGLHRSTPRSGDRDPRP
jgi:soluble lytic murein transglycosylase-like protein